MDLKWLPDFFRRPHKIPSKTNDGSMGTPTTVPYGLQSDVPRRQSTTIQISVPRQISTPTTTVIPYSLQSDVPRRQSSTRRDSVPRQQAQQQSTSGQFRLNPDTYTKAIKLVQQNVFQRKKAKMNIIVLDMTVDDHGIHRFVRTNVLGASLCDNIGHFLYKNSSIVRKMYNKQKEFPITFEKAQDVLICFTTFLIDPDKSTDQKFRENYLTPSKIRKNKWDFISKLSSDDFLFSYLPDEYKNKSLVIVVTTFHVLMNLFPRQQARQLIHKFVD